MSAKYQSQMARIQKRSAPCMQNIRFIAFSDQHLESKLYNIPELEQDNRDLFKMAVDKAIELDVDYLVSVGDLFDNNKPSSDTIKFVSGQIARLKPGVAVAIAGDHSKPINGSTWENVCGFKPISSVPEFAGVDYSDNPADVIHNINHQLLGKPRDTVKFIFMHQQVPELWPFCEDKKKISIKDIDFSNQCGSIEGLFLGDIHIRRSIEYWDVNCKKNLFAGYCGSLGVTAANETEKPGLYYHDGDKLTNITYELPRKYVTIDIHEHVAESAYLSKFKKTYEEYTKESKRPVFLIKLHNGADIGNHLNFLYDIGYVRVSKVKKDKDGAEELINIRSELKTTERFQDVLKQLTKDSKNREQLHDLTYKLLTSEDTKSVLDEFKQNKL
jgi:DNA repair exonuclease SbcCD nuclease subunit